MEFRQRLDMLMQSRGMTMYRLAQEMDCSQSTVKKWLDGETTPQRAKLKQLASIFNVSTGYLLGETDKKTATPEDNGLTDAQQELIDLVPSMTKSEVDVLLAAAKAQAAARQSQDSRK